MNRPVESASDYRHSQWIGKIIKCSQKLTETAALSERPTVGRLAAKVYCRSFLPERTFAARRTRATCNSQTRPTLADHVHRRSRQVAKSCPAGRTYNDRCPAGPTCGRNPRPIASGFRVPVRLNIPQKVCYSLPPRVRADSNFRPKNNQIPPTKRCHSA